MKNYSKFLIILFFSIFNFSLFSQSNNLFLYSDVFDFANELKNKGAEKEAALEFKRFIFLQNSENTKMNNDAIARSYDYLSYYYEKNNDLILALNYQRLSCNLISNPKSMINEISLIDKISIQNKQALATDYKIFSFIQLETIPLQVRKFAMLSVLNNCLKNRNTSLFIEQFNNSQNLFQDLFTEEELITINETIEQLKNIKLKKPKTAAYLSIFPGLGQLYAGDYKDALNAFLLDGTLIALSVYSIATLDLWTFSLLEMDLLVRFYRGNLYNAQKETFTYNYKKYDSMSAPIQKILETNIGQIKEMIYN